MGKSLELFDDVSIRFTYVGMSMHRYVYEYGFRFKLNAVCVEFSYNSNWWVVRVIVKVNGDLSWHACRSLLDDTP